MKFWVKRVTIQISTQVNVTVIPFILRSNLHRGHLAYFVDFIDSIVPQRSQNKKSGSWEYAMTSMSCVLREFYTDNKRKCDDLIRHDATPKMVKHEKFFLPHIWN